MRWPPIIVISVELTIGHLQDAVLVLVTLWLWFRIFGWLLMGLAHS